MINFFKKLLGKDKDKEIKRFSSTTTSATEGSNAKKDLDPEIKEMVDRLKNGHQINHSELNKLAQFYFNVGYIPRTLYKFNPVIQQGMTFEIDSVDTSTNEVNDIVSIHLSMKELVYNVDIVMRISVEDFHEFLQPITPEVAKES